MLTHLTQAGTMHTVLAMLCIAIGGIQLLRPKGGAVHRALGYAYVYAMILADGAVMLIYRFTGQFNLFHVGALVNFACIVLAMVPVLRSPRPAGWRLHHYYWIAWSYVGLLAAAATELIARTSQLATRGQIWVLSALMTMLVTVVGSFLIRRNRPPSPPRPAAESTGVQHEGAPS